MQNQPRVAMWPDGTFVVTWTSTPITRQQYQHVTTPPSSPASTTRLGSPLGNEFQVTPSSTVGNSLSDVAMDSNDDFVVVWEGDLQSTSWGVYGKYFTVSAATAAIVSATETGSTVTITTSTAGGFAVGNTVIISGVATPGYNGTFTITSVSGKTFTYNNVTTGLPASGGGKAALPLKWSCHRPNAAYQLAEQPRQLRGFGRHSIWCPPGRGSPCSRRPRGRRRPSW